MMNDFIFNLQRFDDEEQSPITIAGNRSSVVTLANNVSLTIANESDNSLVASISSDKKYAIISLSSANDVFSVNGVKYGLKTASTTETNGKGIIISLGGSSSAIVGGIDSGDILYVGSEEFSMTTAGLFAGTNNAADKVYQNASVSKVSLNYTLPTDSSSNWDKILAISGNTLSIEDTSDFSTLIGGASYKGVIVSDTNPASFKKYASLDAGVNYVISSLTGAETLSHISLASGLMSQVGSEGKGIRIDDNFASTAETLPYIEVGNTTVKVNSASGDFFVSGGYGSNLASLDSKASEVSLISGSLVTSNQTQTISAGNYKVTGYNDTLSTNYDGIEIQSDTNGNVTFLGDIDVGESFVLGSGASSTSYTMTALGLIKEGETVRPLVYNSSVLTAGSWTAEQITAATAYDSQYYLSATDAVITISTVNANTPNPTLIAYGNDAIASLKYGGNGNFSLLSPYDYATELQPGNWKGISLASDVTLNLSKEFTGDG
ncbi:MAG: hypothetical protein IJP68_02595, partial [Selenomonadaceae bacterium]|nr:hypothetical protein [Selenomonadaceae bacterium]